VKVAPETTKISVFNSGISVGINTCIPLGGKTPPISIVGAKAAEK